MRECKAEVALIVSSNAVQMIQFDSPGYELIEQLNYSACAARYAKQWQTDDNNFPGPNVHLRGEKDVDPGEFPRLWDAV
jgi:hypothetical protein